jgi:hypothetical protein
VPLNFTTETNPGQIAVADFNNDNNLDIAVVISGASVVAIHLGNGNGTFGLSDIWTTANNPQALAIKDFTGDGIVDIATINASGSISMLRSLGNGNFALAVNSPAISGIYGSIVAADLDSDGDNDIMVATRDGNELGARSYANNGNGVFSAELIHSIGAGTGALATGDFDSNGLTDIVSSPVGSEVAGTEIAGTLSILQRNAMPRTFTRRTFTLINRLYSYGLVSADFNNDGRDDIAVTNGHTNNLSIYLNTGNSDLFGVSTEYSIGAIGQNQGAGLGSGDFNNDGKIDLIAQKKGRFFLLANRGDGTFQAPLSASTNFYSPNANSIALGNFNGDSQIDMLTGSIAINSLRGDGTGKFSYQNFFRLRPGDPIISTQIIPADFDDDGKQDVLDITSYLCFPGGCPGLENITIHTGNGDGSFNVTNRIFTVGRQPVSAAVGDFNSDGRLDAVVASFTGIPGSNGSLSYLRGNGQGSFNTAVNYVVGGGAYWIDKGDFNGDGKLDVVVTRRAGNDVAVLLNNGDGTFSAPTTFAVGTNPTFVTVRDLNNDSKLDLIVVNRDSNNISILFGNGNGTFGAATNFGGLSSPISTTLADFNGDTILDLAVANTTGGFVSVLSGLGNGIFSAPTNFQTDVVMVAIVAHDFNGDGKVDIATASAAENKSDAIILLNNGNFGSVANGTKNFDFDGDGRADISVFRPSDRNWYLNRSSQGFAAVQWGIATDKIAPADYDGDGKTDVAVWREGSLANFYVLNSGNNTVRIEQFGQTGDVLTVGDWDGDGKADPAVYRDSAVGAQSYFYYRGSNNNPNRNVTFLPWGTTGDKPQLGDFDNDGKTDLAVFRSSNNTWYIRQSSDSQIRYENWGLATDKFVPADYDGDGKTDLAVFRNGTWYIRNSSNNQPQIINFGINSDAPVPADYDGDGKSDIAVFRGGTWYLRQSTSGVSIQQFGFGTDKPVPAAFIP